MNGTLAELHEGNLLGYSSFSFLSGVHVGKMKVMERSLAGSVE
jgi:hypothetical protein